MKASSDVLVIGAGVGGLATALELHKAGLGCRIVEAVPEFGPVGVGINLLPHAARYLNELGLEEALSSDAILTQGTAFYNSFGQLVYREPAGRWAGYPDPQYSIHRAHLHSVMLDAVTARLGADAVLVGHKVTGVDEGSDKVVTRIEREDGSVSSLESDVVIAADGIHSVVRRQFFPDEGPARYSGVMMWRGITVAEPYLDGATMVRVGSLASGQLVAYPIRENVDGNGRQLVNWVVEIETAQRSGRGWNREGQLADFAEWFAGWHFDWLDVPAMLAAAELILEYPMVDQDPLPYWTRGRVTLLGDAAHPMIPRGSNGAGQTVIDAAVIAECLAHAPEDPLGALREYERRRLPATAQVVVGNRTESPDKMLRLVHERTGGRPFERIEDVISAEELAAIANGYRTLSGAVIPGAG